MYWLRRLLLLLPGQRRIREQELEDEMRAHLAMALDDARESELPPAAAERKARREFGNMTRALEEARAVWMPGWDRLSQDVRFAARTLLRNPLFSLIAILSLAFGTGAATVLFSVVDTVVLKPLAYRDPGQLVMIREVVQPIAHVYPTLPVNLQHFRFMRSEARSFESLGALRSRNITLRVGNDAEALGAAQVTAELFHLLGVRPALGRFFRSEEETKGSVVILTDALWRRRFGASPSIVGQQVRLDDQLYSVVGVLPADFRFPRKDDLGALASLAERTDMFVPLQGNSGWGGDHDFTVLGRLKPGVGSTDAKAELNVLTARISAEHKLNYGLRVEVEPLQDVIGSPVRSSLTVLLAAVLTLVLIVCVNLANLLLARGSARSREYSMRMALGAGRGRLVLAALTETLMLSVIGGGLGILAAYAALRIFVSTAPIDLPRIDEIAIDARVLAFAIGLTILCGILFGLLPALRLSRSNTIRPESVSIAGNRGTLRLRECLVGAEVALGACLLFLAVLLVSSLWNVLQIDRGFAAERSMEVRLMLPSRYRENQNRIAFFDHAVQRLRALPGVQAVAAASKVPLTGESNVNDVRLSGSDAVALDPVTRSAVMVNARFVGDGYFSALGIPVLQGRAIEAADRDRRVVVVSKLLAAKLWPGQNPIGKRVSAGSQIRDASVVGVAADVHTTRLERDPTLMIYSPYWKDAKQVFNIVIQSSGEPASVMNAVLTTLRSIDPEIPAPRIRPMEEILAEVVSQRRLQMTVAGVFATSALLLSAMGIYGVVAYGVTLRRREIGIRMALGARAAQVRGFMAWQGLRPVLSGGVAGIVLALFAGRLIKGVLYGVASTDGWVLAFVTLLMTFVALLASLIPAQSAARVDPARVLRAE